MVLKTTSMTNIWIIFDIFVMGLILFFHVLGNLYVSCVPSVYVQTSVYENVGCSVCELTEIKVETDEICPSTLETKWLSTTVGRRSL